MRLLIFIIFLSCCEDIQAKNRFSAGINYGGERVTFYSINKDIYNGGDYNPMNTKIGFEGFYITDLFGIGIGISKFEDQYNLRQINYIDLWPITFDSKNISFSLKAYINFKERPNTFFFSLVNEFVYSTSATKIIYGAYGADTEILKLEKTTFNRWDIEFGIGYKLHLVEKFSIKIMPYYSVSASSKSILFELPEFYKLGISVGLLREF